MSQTIDFNNIDIDKIPTVEKKSSFDAKLYDGLKVKIEKLNVVSEINFYPDGKNYDAKSVEKMWRVYIYTEGLKDQNNKVIELEKDGKTDVIRIHTRFNLLTGKDGQPEISKHDKAKLWKFMRKHNVSKLSELIGKSVILTTEPSKVEGDDRLFLRIVQ